jgi:four helix bundle protein
VQATHGHDARAWSLDIWPTRLYRELYRKLYRQVGKARTSVILNIAEAYRWTRSGDRLRLLEMAEGSAAKAAVYLDLCVSKSELDTEQRLPGIELLGRVVLMLRVPSGSLSE